MFDFSPAWITVRGRPGIYDVAIVEAGQAITVVVREREDNAGISVTNGIEDIASTIGMRVGSDRGLRFFEESYSQPGIYHEVTFAVAKDGRYGSPSWRLVASASEIITGRHCKGEDW